MYFVHGIYSGYTQKEKEFHLVDRHYHSCERFTLLMGIQLFIVDALMYSTNTPNFVTSICIWFHLGQMDKKIQYSHSSFHIIWDMLYLHT
jgi:hypothetical protein